ncbi:hypothetical protein BGP78_04105 [Pseudoalteromonas sp. MSK9-3]|uniref:hypothetical protein n=1 Tax=Pseudoalteromonas sp. MSK9-3 TaxID=1897633 RepID=UPI000E6D0651|nr:hypothetical protein [Pseudoalteromonas sp. MSK9-3]RJE70764.1 hypothetical protein BGP78_04105 [Pseudoalteromonas sp. MSK9-3]
MPKPYLMQYLSHIVVIPLIFLLGGMSALSWIIVGIIVVSDISLSKMHKQTSANNNHKQEIQNDLSSLEQLSTVIIPQLIEQVICAREQTHHAVINITAKFSHIVACLNHLNVSADPSKQNHFTIALAQKQTKWLEQLENITLVDHDNITIDLQNIATINNALQSLKTNIAHGLSQEHQQKFNTTLEVLDREIEDLVSIAQQKAAHREKVLGNYKTLMTSIGDEILALIKKTSLPEQTLDSNESPDGIKNTLDDILIELQFQDRVDQIQNSTISVLTIIKDELACFITDKKRNAHSKFNYQRIHSALQTTAATNEQKAILSDDQGKRVDDITFL